MVDQRTFVEQKDIVGFIILVCVTNGKNDSMNLKLGFGIVIL